MRTPKRIQKVVDTKWDSAVPFCYLSKVARFQKSGHIYERISNKIFCQIKIKFGKCCIDF
jgi:hypothetical protein